MRMSGQSWVAGAMGRGKPDDMVSANSYEPIQDIRDRTSAPAGTGLRHEPRFLAAMTQGRLNTSECKEAPIHV